jgi:triacylglycerol lipase
MKHDVTRLLFCSVLILSSCAPDEMSSPATEETDEQIGLFAAQPLFAEPRGRADRYPIVLGHGFDASPTNRWGFNGVAEALRRDGHTVYVAMVPPYDSPAVRARALAMTVDRALAETRASKVNLISHSMGGLDARELISVLGYGNRVASLTTISSPHRGTRVADVALGLLPMSADDGINALASAWGLTYNNLAGDSHIRAAMTALSEASAPAFNQSHPNDARVYYQSWAGVSSLGGIPGPNDGNACRGLLLRQGRRADAMDVTLLPMAALTAHGTELRPNDGMATVASAMWGNFRGCIPADHLDEVGQVNDTGMNTRTGFDHLRFYRTIAFELATKGF